MGVARPLAGAALAAVLLALSGCSAIIAAAGRPDDLSVVRRGALRDDVEHELGRPSRERAAGHGIEATYKVRVGPGGSPSANAGAVARAGLDTFESVTFGGFRNTPLNNATLLARMRYYHRLPDFQALLEQHGVPTQMIEIVEYGS